MQTKTHDKPKRAPGFGSELSGQVAAKPAVSLNRDPKNVFSDDQAVNWR
jgi:hypothetical protein